mgnify:CR=1 FL=1
MHNPYLLPIAKQIDVDIQYGNGCFLYDTNGKAYLDCLSGMGVNALGHKHPSIQKAIQTQMERNLHLFGYFQQDVHVDLAKALVENTHFDRVFYSNSGTEAMEAALKLVKKWGNQKGKNEIICFHGGFHGRTIGGLSITAQASKQEPFQPLLPGIKAIEKSIEAISESISEKTTAVVLELITGEGGIFPTSEAFISALVELRQKYGFLIIIDEIQAGIGRTGTLFSYMHYNFQPDLITVAKGIGGGLPLGVLMIPEHLANVFSAGEHGSTFGGNPLACATGNAVLNEIIKHGLLDHVAAVSEYFFKKLHELKSEYPIIKDIRGKGLMIGVEIGDIASKVMNSCIKNGLFLNATQGHTIRFLPPLIISKDEVDQAIEIFKTSLNAHLDEAET